MTHTEMHNVKIMLPKPDTLTRKKLRGLSAHTPLALTVLLSIALSCVATTAPVAQSSASVIAIVNDRPVTEYAVLQRMKINSLLGSDKTKGVSKSKLRKKAIDELIDDVLKKVEAKRQKIAIPKAEVDRLIGQIAKSGNDTVKSFTKKLARQGIRLSSLRNQLESQLAWNTILQRRFGNRVKVSDREVDRRHTLLTKKPVNTTRLLNLKQIVFRYENGAPAGIVRSRFLEAQNMIQQFKGCGSLGRILANVPGVGVRDLPNIPLSGLPPQLVKVLSKIGRGGISPPNRTRTGIELIAYCSRRDLKPPSISKKDVENALREEQFLLHGTRYLRDLRKEALIDRRG